ncbi:Oligosaccharide translocation protein rft1 [Imshaugia aleurites]|uniref:Man(5)GlcNAc(2)-PP-dolichol translocation protein RFT1 n=1 Tax=Imshaugia aleurites TaxID=172621 RepID=A0A8H3G3L0_9LECA|nr:Oligosaccharide translocation protein rft1 [Imshaugia aleurites]
MSRTQADLVKEKTKTEPSNVDSLPSKSVKGASFLILLQIGCRALAFIVNQILLRFLSPHILGLSAQLELFSISTLYFARESLRNALQHKPSDDEQTKTAEGVGREEEKGSDKAAVSYGTTRRMQEVVNLSHAAIAIGFPLTLAFTWLYLQKADTAVLESHHMRSSLYTYALATVIELLNEPAFNVARQEMMYATRASAEFLAFFTRALISCSVSIWVGVSGRNLGVLPFAVGQLGYAVTLNVLYFSNVYPVCARNAVSLLAKPITSSTDYFVSRFSRPLIKRTATLYGQNIFNQLLTYGDGYLIATFASLPSQGAYALASNYGGLLARIILQPIEESSRSLFGRLPASQPASKAKDTAILSQAKTHLTTLLRLYLLLSLFATCLGPPLAPILLRLVAGSRWTHTEAPAVLATYCYYIPLLAINGILEAFVSVVATDPQITRQTVWKVAFFGAFAGTGFLVLRVLGMGARGLVLANAVAMGLRICWSWAFVQGYLRSVGHGEGLRLGSLLPSTGSVAIGVAARGALVVLESGTGRYGGWGELLRCGLVAGVCVIGVGFFERDFLMGFVPVGLLERFPFLRRFTHRK